MATVPNPPPGFDDLPIEDQIEYVQSLWEHIAASAEKVPIPDWHRRVLDERLREHEQNPKEAQLWKDVEKDLRSRLRRASGDE